MFFFLTSGVNTLFSPVCIHLTLLSVSHTRQLFVALINCDCSEPTGTECPLSYNHTHTHGTVCVVISLVHVFCLSVVSSFPMALSPAPCCSIGSSLTHRD